MKKFSILLIGLLLVVLIGSSANATQMIMNGDFNSGLSDWDTAGNVQATTAGPFAAAQGMVGNYALLGFGTTSGTSSLSQDFTISNATSITLSFDYAFDFFDINLFVNDTFLALTAYDGTVAGTVTMLDLQSSLIGLNYGSYTQTINLNPMWTLDTDMTFTLTEAGGSWKTGGTLSAVGLDNISAITTAPVPEPATMILLGTGLAGLAGLRRRKK